MSAEADPGTIPALSEENADDSQIVKKQLNRHQREIHRLRNTVSFRLGKHLTDAARNPWKLLVLPISFPLYTLRLGLESLGKRVNSSMLKGDLVTFNAPRNCVVLFPTNGVGFGHFTRMFAVATKIRQTDPSTEIVFFTPMPTLHVPYLENFPTYHMAGKYKFSDMSTSTWNGLIEEHLLMVLETHQPKMFMFDGAFPYRGMLNAVSRVEGMKRVWVRRGMFKKGTSVPVDSLAFFDKIVHPGDAVDETHKDLLSDHTNVIKVPPMISIDKETMLSRESARHRLGLPLGSHVWYVQLGAGQINDIHSEINMTLHALLQSSENSYVVLGESLLGERIDYSHERVRILRDYPNSIYFNAFDSSVQAGGYNSFHEMRINHIPTLFFPNMNTGMDDQLARCEVAEQEGWGMVVKKRDISTIKAGIASMAKLRRSSDAPEDLDWGDWIAEFL